jgi:hypothetical protein
VRPSAFLDSFDEFCVRYRRILSAVSITWFVLTSANYAGFISLPRIPLLTGLSAMIASGLWAALWWGAIIPWAETHREHRAKNEMKSDNG